MTFSHVAVLARTASSRAGQALRRTSGRIGVRQRACQCSILAEEFWNQERPLGLASLLLPPRRPAGLLPRPIGCCTPLALCAPICLLYTDHPYFIQFHPDTYTGHANVEETVTAAKLLTKLT